MKWPKSFSKNLNMHINKILPTNPSKVLLGLWILRALWRPQITLWPPGDCLPQNTTPTLQWIIWQCKFTVNCCLKLRKKKKEKKVPHPIFRLLEAEKEIRETVVSHVRQINNEFNMFSYMWISHVYLSVINTSSITMEVYLKKESSTCIVRQAIYI